MTTTLKVQILIFPQMKFNKMQNKKKQTLLVLAQDRSHTMFRINSNNHTAVYVDEKR